MKRNLEIQVEKVIKEKIEIYEEKDFLVEKEKKKKKERKKEN